ncbi:hypothetical protein LQ318_15495 [Aliifodinibius salicampi]|uniref:Uncharacterized protein n=1 Tax=Fodinibius salicampi TaxID=1920655 RepID=A0ABT3Q2H0_9BACT|nr:hypothetical protein [Fodinibius salicampi]MCW9714312.1 hypothetical protein [Fodinibius salicampi]
MKKLVGMFAAFLIIAAFTSVNSGIDGTWIGKMDSPNGPVEITYNFNVDEDTLTGTVEGGMGEIEILNGQVDGNEFSFDTQFNGATISHECVLEDDDKIVMEFTFEGQGGPGPSGPQELILTRASE